MPSPEHTTTAGLGAGGDSEVLNWCVLNGCPYDIPAAALVPPVVPVAAAVAAAAVAAPDATVVAAAADFDENAPIVIVG
jgi:hypothetical protein